MPNRAAEQMSFGWRVNEAHFRGGALRSDGGPMPLRQVDRRIGLTWAVAAVPSDRRAPKRITHPLRDLLLSAARALAP